MHIGQSDTSLNSPSSSTFEVGFFIHLLCPFFSDSFGLRIFFSNGLQTSESTEGYGSTYCILLRIIISKLCYIFNMQKFWLIWHLTDDDWFDCSSNEEYFYLVGSRLIVHVYDDYPCITLTSATLLTFRCFILD